jgi:phage recombination protein Bet
MNALAKTETTAQAVMSRTELRKVLQASLYPGASDASVDMVMGYCEAARLDPMQKPVHIVPMWDSKAGAMRDVVMPGVNLYRTQAMRSGECAGVTEPEFGPDMQEAIGGQPITFPAWCRVTVKRRLPTGEIVDFTAREFWKENYAIKGGKEKSIAPNAMWSKRPYGQIAKCAEAQALRKAFPEIASQPTADEMEGKTMHADEEALKFDWLDPKPILDGVAFIKDDAQGAAYWKQWSIKLVNQKGDYQALKDAVIAKRKALAEALKAAAKPEAKPEGTSPDTNPAPKVTFASVMENMTKAKNEDALAVAADWIGEVADPEQRKELSAKYDELLAAMRGAA